MMAAVTFPSSYLPNLGSGSQSLADVVFISGLEKKFAQSFLVCEDLKESFTLEKRKKNGRL